ncbi:hypothetical protein COHA_005710 [Chlorella ohadii]|uniref:Uncharacterized protein n=1 Tax=Chlorella ohadii TaxID=2649997 RepID=A0AAD5DR96_9CHLO|nr:hypothetical protein COHA_005710 [Chlorella ohadii]
MATRARKMLGDLTNRPEALAARSKPPPKAAAARQQPPQPTAEQPELGQQLDECDAVLRSFHQLSFDGPEAAAEQDEPAQLEAEDSGASTATAGSTNLGSPLAAFAAAKERLARNTLDADSLLESWRQGSTQPPAPDAATPRPAAHTGGQILSSTCTARSSLLARLPLATGNVLPQHRRQHVLLLRERLAATMQLCQALHEQNQGNLAKVAQLVADNQHLSRSLHEARLDKEALQATIRALTREAAMLAEQAQRALLPAAQPAEPLPTTAVPAAAAAAEPEGLSLVRDWSQALTEGSSQGSSGRQPGATWQPGTSVRSFEWEGVGDVQQGAAAAAYAQGGGGEGAACDKRRRLAPGMLAHCLRPAIREAVAEAAAMDAASASSSCRLPTPGRTPKRKLRQLSSGSMAAASSAAAAAECAAALVAAEAAVAPEQQPALAPAAAAAAPVAESMDFRTFELFESRWYGAAKAPAAHQGQRASTCRIM